MSDKIRSTRPQKSIQRCSICLSSIRIKGNLDSCEHPFCFNCIQQWSKIENTCPICKRRFTEIEERGNDKSQSSHSRKKKSRVAKISRKNQEDRDYQMIFQGIQEGLIEEIPQEFIFLNQLIFQGIQEIDFGDAYDDQETPINPSME